MKSFKCDICKIEVGEYELRTLYDYYISDEIKHACPDCLYQIEDTIKRVDNAMNPIKVSWVRKIVKKLAAG